MRILVSGASIAGPVLAFWLSRYGFEVTVVERAPALRKTGGHPVDLFRPAMEISERMGVLARIEELVTGTERLVITREGSARPAEIDLGKVFSAASDRHVEIMRDDLSEIYYDAGRDDVEYVFGDRITAISPDGDVTFEHGTPRRFDLVVGADGLHSGVRRLVFGDAARHVHLAGAYISVVSVPKELGRDRVMRTHVGPGRVAAAQGARHLPDARVGFLFRNDREGDDPQRDVGRQKELLRRTFAGMHPEVDRWLGELDATPAFYFDAVTQLQLDSWSRGRVTLVGDAAYCPGPAVGGSTSLAVLGAYVLAGELAAARGDHESAYPAYEREMGELVRRSRAFARGVARTLIPTSALGVRTLVGGARLLTALPAPIGRALAKANNKGLRLHDSMTVKDYTRST